MAGTPLAQPNLAKHSLSNVHLRPARPWQTHWLRNFQPSLPTILEYMFVNHPCLMAWCMLMLHVYSPFREGMLHKTATRRIGTQYNLSPLSCQHRHLLPWTPVPNLSHRVKCNAVRALFNFKSCTTSPQGGDQSNCPERLPRVKPMRHLPLLSTKRNEAPSPTEQK